MNSETMGALLQRIDALTTRLSSVEKGKKEAELKLAELSGAVGAMADAKPRDGRDGRDGKDGGMITPDKFARMLTEMHPSVMAFVEKVTKSLPPKEELIGPQGKPGLRGEKGDQGQDGKPGMRGPMGQKGKDGRDGTPGIRGKDGRDGKDGRGGCVGGAAPIENHAAAQGASHQRIAGAKPADGPSKDQP